MSTPRPRFDDPHGWQDGSGNRSKVFSDGAASLRLVELTPEANHPDWCETGHSGCVVEGVLEVEFDDHVERYETGDAILIAPGPAGRHRPRALTGRVRLVLVDHEPARAG